MEWIEVIKILLFINGQNVADAEQWTEAVLSMEPYTETPAEVLLALSIVDTGMNVDYRDEQYYGAWKMRLDKKTQTVFDFCGLDPEDCAHTQATWIISEFKNNYNKCQKDLNQAISAHKHNVCSKDKKYISKVQREISYIRQLRNNYEVK